MIFISIFLGHPPAEAARIALSRITTHYPEFEGGLVALSKDGIVGAACHGLKSGIFNLSLSFLTQFRLTKPRYSSRDRSRRRTRKHEIAFRR